MKALKVLGLLAGALALACTQTACMSHLGVEPAEGIIYDRTYGTMYISPDIKNNFSMEKLGKFRRYQTYKVVIPAPFTFGCLSFGWGQVSTKEIMEEAQFKKLFYAQYRRLSVATVYTNYEIVAYGE